MSVCIIVVTSDSTSLGLTDFFQEKFCMLGKVSVLKKGHCFQSSDVCSFYPEKINKTYFPAMLANYIYGKSDILMLESDSQNLFERVNNMKGKFRVTKEGELFTSGLRNETKANIEYLEGNACRYNFRLHTSDNHDETELITSLLG